MNKIAVLIPCYNEEKTIGKVVADFKAALPEAEIYVYDNNSTDATVQKAEGAGATVRKELRQGKGNVVRQMFMDVDADCYVLVDGDDTYPAYQARQMCTKIMAEGFDMVVGDRLSSTYFSENKRLFHGSGNRCVRYLINHIFKSDVKDIMTGYRTFSRKFVKSVPILSKGFEIETEMTIYALDRNLKICQIPVKYRDRPDGSESKLNTLSDGMKVLKTIFCLYRDYKPLKFFSVVALIVFHVAIIMLMPVFAEYFKTGLVPRYPTLIVCGFMVLLSLLLWVCGLILEVMLARHRQMMEMIDKKFRNASNFI